MTKFLNNADIKGYIAQTAVTSYLLKADSTGRLVAAIAGTDYQAPTTALLPSGGTAGQILAKIDGTNYNAQWIDNFAQQIKYDVKLGAALSKGTPVYVSSANGTNIIVSASSNATEATSSKTLGLLETGGALNDIVKVVSDGLLSGLNTSAATIGDPVWLGVNGALIFGLANKPSAPAHLVYIGAVTRVHAVNGEIFIKVQNGFELDELHNVALSSVADGQGLFYESATSLWKNKTIASVLGYTPANDLAVVHLAGTETITGVKTFSSVINASTLSLNGGTLAGNNIVSMRSNPTGGQFRIEKSDGSLSAYPFYIGVDGTALAYYYNAAGALKVLLHTNDTSYFGNSLSIGYATYASTSYMLDVNGIARFAGAYVSFNDNGYIRGDATGWLSLQNGINGFRVRNNGNTSDYFTITQSTGAATFSSSVTATSFIKSGGTSAQFLKADGSVDSSTYLTSITSSQVTTALGYTPYNATNPSGYITSSALSSYLPLSGGTLTGNIVLGSGTIGSIPSWMKVITTDATQSGLGAVYNNKAIYVYNNGSVLKIDAYDYATSTALDIQVGGNGGKIILSNGQVRFTTYTSATSYSGTAAGYLAFDSSGNVITVAGVAATDNTKLPLAGGTMTGALVVSAADRGFEVNASGGISLYSNEINAGALGGTGTIYLGWRRTSQVNVGVPMALSSSISATSGSFSGVLTISKDIGTNDYPNTGQHNMQLRIRKASTDGGCAPRTLELGVLDNGTGIIQSQHCGVGYNTLALNPVSGTVTINGSTALHAGNYNSYSPTLTGGGASGTWGINITGNAATLGGYGPNQTGGANTIVQRDANGYIQNSYFYTSGGGSERGTGISYVAGFNSSDYYIRSYTLQGLASAMSGASMNISGNATTTSQTNFSNLTIGGAQVWYNSGSWLGDLASYGFTRAWGLSMSGGSEFVLLYKNGQGYTLVDGSYYAYEGGGFYSSSNSAGNTLLGFNADTTSSVNFNTATVKANGNTIWHAGNMDAPNRSGTSYYQVNTWLQMNGTHGMYWPSYNGAHIYANTSGNYGSIRIDGTRNGWKGIYFDSGNTLMMNNNESGHYQDGYGWKWRWYNGSMYISTNSYGGGSEYSVWHSGNLTNLNQLSNGPGYQTNSGQVNNLSTNYAGGQQLNPQVYFNNGIGLKVAMTASWGYWSDTMWVNGYAGGDVPWMCALHFQRNSQPRMAISAQTSSSGGYGTLYEVITAWNIADQTVSTANNLSGFDKTNPSFGAVYASNWFRAQGDCGLYTQDYGGHFRRNTNSYGTWETFGYNKNGWGGIVVSNNYVTSQMHNSSGDFGFLTENGSWWNLFYNRGNNCWGIGTDNTYSGDGFRCIKYGSAEYGWTTWSDRRAKENISTITGALDTVLAMRGVYFNYIKDEAKNKRVGFIAQELESVLPEAVRYAEEIDEYSVEYAQIVSVLAEAIKEQNIKIQGLEAQLQTLLN